MEYKDYYTILGVDRNAPQEAIKRAYKKLARKYHPDVSKEADAEARFKEINEAYHVLKDPDKRKAYDQLGSQWQQGQEFRPPPDWEFHSEGINPEELGGFSDFFAEIFGNAAGGHFHTRQRNYRVRGQDLHASVEITLEEAFNGASRTLSLLVPDIDGQGRMRQRKRQFTVQIPRGVREGQQIRLAGQGGAGMGGGQPGDLYLEVRFAPHPLFRAVGRDIFLDLPITPWEAALGASLDIPTLGGRVTMTIPPGSQSGRKLRLKGRGLPGKQAGDQYLELRIVTPPANSEAARAFYRKMAETLPYDPRKATGV